MIFCDNWIKAEYNFVKTSLDKEAAAKFRNFLIAILNTAKFDVSDAGDSVNYEETDSMEKITESVGFEYYTVGDYDDNTEKGNNSR